MTIQEFFATKRSRAEIAEYFGCNDREARERISDLQRTYNIVNLQDGKGYFIADNETTRKYAEQELARALKCFNKARVMFERVKENTDDIMIPVKAHFRRLHAPTNDKDENQLEWGEET